ASFRAQALELLRRFHALGSRVDPEARTDRDHRANDGEAVVLAGHIANEGAVDLDLVEWELAQVPERRIAGAEVVERNPDADVAQLVQRRERAVALVQKHGFSDLQLQPGRRYA